VLLQVDEDPAIWRVPILGDGAAEIAHPAEVAVSWSRWWATRRGVWVHRRSDPERQLWLCEPGSTTVRATGTTLPEGTVELAFTASGERALATRLDRVESDLVLVLGELPGSS
jgi:hypothetical protein